MTQKTEMEILISARDYFSSINVTFRQQYREIAIWAIEQAMERELINVLRGNPQIAEDLLTPKD